MDNLKYVLIAVFIILIGFVVISYTRPATNNPDDQETLAPIHSEFENKIVHHGYVCWHPYLEGWLRRS